MNKTSTLSNSFKQQYISDYQEAAMISRFYDQFASPVGKDMSELKRSTAINVPFLSSLPPATTAISEDTDITPVVFKDATAQITPTSRANAVIVSEKLLNTTYTDFNSSYYKKLGENMMSSIDLLSMAAAISGGFVKSPAARSSLDAGTTTHRLTRSQFSQANVMLTGFKVPMWMTPRGRRWIAALHPFAYQDLMNDTVLLAVGEYQKPEMVLNYELGELLGFSVVVSAWSKAFWAAGAANASAINTTLTADTPALGLSITVAANTNIDVGDRIMVGPAVETGSTYQATNESFIVKTVVSNTIGLIGEGENGGCKYDHYTGEVVKNNDNVFPCIFGGPESLAKVYDTEVGEYGQIVGPKKDGLADQFTSLAWKWYGGYGILAENRILRMEVSSSIDA